MAVSAEKAEMIGRMLKMGLQPSEAAKIANVSEVQVGEIASRSRGGDGDAAGGGSASIVRAPRPSTATGLRMTAPAPSQAARVRPMTANSGSRWQESTLKPGKIDPQQASRNSRLRFICAGGKRLHIKIISARGLRCADWAEGDLSDPFVVCQIPGKRQTKFQTPIIYDDLNPVWEHEAYVDGFAEGDSLVFTCFDDDEGQKSDLLGRATMRSEDFYPDGFLGEVKLTECGQGVMAYLQVQVTVVGPSPVDKQADVDAHSEGADSNEDIVGVSLERVWTHVYRRRLRVKEFFIDFDKQKSGRCTRDQFGKAISNIIHPNTVDDLETPIYVDTLADHFIEVGPHVQPPCVINYDKFCKVMDQVFWTADLFKTPLAKVPRPGAFIQDSTGFNPRDVEDDDAFWRTMYKIAVLVTTRGLQLATVFENCSRSDADRQAGRMEPEKFAIYFPLAVSTPTKQAALTEPELELLYQRYTDENGYMNLHCFEREVEAVLEQIKSKHDPPAADADADAAEVPTRLEKEGPSALGSRPSSAHSANSQSRIQSLPRPASAASFVGTATLGRSKSATRMTSATVKKTKLCASSITLDNLLKNCELPVPADLMVRIREAVSSRRLDLRGRFKEVDRLRRGLVNFTQMKSALTILRIELALDEYDEVFKRYRSADGMFRYRNFCADVEALVPPVPPARLGSTAAGGSPAVAIRTLAQSRRQAEHIKDMIGKKVRAHRMHIKPIFEDFCSRSWAQRGHVTGDQLQRILVMLGFRLTDEQLSLLLHAYSDSQQGTEFNFVKFCADIDPRKDVEPHHADSFKGMYFDKNGRIVPLRAQRPYSAPAGHRQR